MVNIAGGVDYLAVKDLKQGDILTFKDEGGWIDSQKYTYEDGNPRKEFVITVEKDGEKKSFRVNKTSREDISKVFTTETKEWIGKKAKVVIEFSKQFKKDCCYLEPLEEAWDEEKS